MRGRDPPVRPVGTRCDATPPCAGRRDRAEEGPLTSRARTRTRAAFISCRRIGRRNAINQLLLPRASARPCWWLVHDQRFPESKPMVFAEPQPEPLCSSPASSESRARGRYAWLAPCSYGGATAGVAVLLVCSPPRSSPAPPPLPL